MWRLGEGFGNLWDCFGSSFPEKSCSRSPPFPILCPSALGLYVLTLIPNAPSVFFLLQRAPCSYSLSTRFHPFSDPLLFLVSKVEMWRLIREKSSPLNSKLFDCFYLFIFFFRFKCWIVSCDHPKTQSTLWPSLPSVT